MNITQQEYDEFVEQLQGADAKEIEKIFKKIDVQVGRIAYYGQRLQKVREQYIGGKDEEK